MDAKRKKIMSGLMARAHWAANWKRLSGVKVPYRVLLSEAMKLEHARLRQAEAAKKSHIIREQLREEQNLGLPLRSTPIDVSRTYHRSSRYVASIGA